MMDTDVIVTRSSPPDRLPSSFGDHDEDNLDRLAASLHHLMLCSRKPSANEPGQNSPADAVAMNEQLRVDAMPAAGEQL
jgi:hypothetical protein